MSAIIDAFLDNKSIYLKMKRFDMSMVDYIKENVKGRRYDPETKLWVAPIITPNLKLLISSSHVSEKSKRKLELYKKILSGGTEAVEKKVKNEFPFLRDYQVRDVAKYFYPISVLNANEMGLGKTWETACWIKMVNKGVYLIFCPSPLIYQWKDELERQEFNLEINTLEGDKKKRNVFLKDFLVKKVSEKKNRPIILLTNYEKLLTDDYDLLVTYKYDAIIYDEITRLKNYKSKTHQRASEMRAKKVIGLTGTPMETSIMDIYNIMEIVSPGYFGGFREFSSKYLNKDQWGYVPKHDAHTRIALKLKFHKAYIRNKKSEVLPELPDLEEKYIKIALDTDEYRNYQKIEDTIVSQYDIDRDMVITNIVGVLTKLRRFVSEPSIYVPTLKNYGHRSKLKYFIQLIESLPVDSKALCFSCFKEVIVSYSKKLEELGIKHIVITGDDSAKEKSIKIKAASSSSKVKAILATDCLKYGANVQFCDYVINIDLPWGPSILNQRIARSHRLGQTKKVTVFNLVSAFTIEEDVAGLIKEKKENFDESIGLTEYALSKIKERVDLARKIKPNERQKKKITDLLKEL